MTLFDSSLPRLSLWRGRLLVKLIAVVTVIIFSGCGQEEPVKAPEVSNPPKLEPVATSLHVRPVYTYALKTIAFNPQGSVLATGNGDGQVRLWSVADAKLIRTFQAHEGWVFSVSYHPNGKWLASGGGDNLVKIWDVATSEVVHELAGHTDDVHGVVFLGDGAQLASAGDDRTVRVWDLANQKAKVLEGHTRQVTAIRASPDGQLLASASRDATVRLWDPATGGEVRSLEGHVADVLDLAFGQNGNRLVTASYDRKALLWDVQSGEQLRTFADHGSRVLSVAVSPDGSNLATGCADQKLRILNLANGELIHAIEFDADASSLDYSPDGHLLAVGLTDGTARLIDMKESPPRQIAQLGKIGSTLPEEISSLTAQQYLDLHLLALVPGDDDWKKAVTQLAEVGDEFSLDVMRDLDKSKLSPEDMTLLANMEKAIHRRTRNQSAARVAAEIQTRLERTATADLRCHAFEGKIAYWTHQWLQPHLDKPEVQQELERIRDHYESDQVFEFGDVKSRIGEYAAKFLKGESVEATR